MYRVGWWDLFLELGALFCRVGFYLLKIFSLLCEGSLHFHSRLVVMNLLVVTIGLGGLGFSSVISQVVINFFFDVLGKEALDPTN